MEQGAGVSQFALYRYFDDGDRLLYVGKSGDIATRDKTHIRRSEWMQFAASSTIERYGTPVELGDAERTAIETEHPLFNRQHNDTPEAREHLRAYLAEAGRLDLMPAERVSSGPLRPSGSEKTCVTPEVAADVAVIREVFTRATASFHAPPDAMQAFEEATALGEVAQELEGTVAELRAHLAARLADVQSLSVAQLAGVLGTSRSRAAQLVTAGRSKHCRYNVAE